MALADNQPRRISCYGATFVAQTENQSSIELGLRTKLWCTIISSISALSVMAQTDSTKLKLDPTKSIQLPGLKRAPKIDGIINGLGQSAPGRWNFRPRERMPALRGLRPDVFQNMTMHNLYVAFRCGILSQPRLSNACPDAMDSMETGWKSI